MIGRISGVLDYRGTDHVLIDVRGVGYMVYCSERTLAALPGRGEPVALYTDLLVREDLLQLFGFSTLLEKEWHRLLVTVQGIGAKASMAILGTLGAEGVARAIALGDWNAVRAAPGVGPKIAQRVVNELKEKAPGVMALGGTLADAETGPVSLAEEPGPSAPARAAPSRKDQDAGPGQAQRRAAAQADALSALVNLGYAQGEAAAAVAEIASAEPEAEEKALIRLALKLSLIHI